MFSYHGQFFDDGFQALLTRVRYENGDVRRRLIEAVPRHLLADPLLEQGQVEQHLVLTRSNLRADELGRSQNTLALLGEVHAAHRGHVVDVVVAEGRGVEGRAGSRGGGRHHRRNGFLIFRLLERRALRFFVMILVIKGW